MRGGRHRVWQVLSAAVRDTDWRPLLQGTVVGPKDHECRRSLPVGHSVGPWREQHDWHSCISLSMRVRVCDGDAKHAWNLHMAIMSLHMLLIACALL